MATQQDTHKQERLDVANTILQQLGGRRFILMTGAKTMIATNKGLKFILTIGKVNGVAIDLEPSDTYTMRFYRVRGQTVTLLGEHSDVYAEDLRGIFERETGLATSL